MKLSRRMAASICLPLLAAAGLCLWVSWPKEITLSFGMMAGSYWDVPNGDCYRIVDETVQRFEAAHPGVRVEYTSGILKRDYSEWISEQMLLGKAPDVFMVEPDDFNTFSSVGALKSLDGLITQDSDFKTSDYYAAAYDAGKYQNSQYALPYESVPTLMFVNKTLLRREGIPVPVNSWTWDDFYNICQKVTRDTNGDGRIDQYGSYDYTWKDAVYSNGASLFNTDGTECYINDSKVIAAIQFVKDMTKLSGNTPPTSQDFDLGQVAFRPFSFSDYRTYKPYPWSIKKYSSFEWDCIKMPAGPDGGNVSGINTLMMGISSKTQNSKLAWEFLKMLTSNESIQQEIFQYSPGVSVLKHVTKSARTRALLNKDAPGGENLNIDALDEVMSSAVIAPKFRKYSGVIQLADSRISELIAGKQDLRPALSTLRRDILSYMQQ